MPGTVSGGMLNGVFGLTTSSCAPDRDGPRSVARTSASGAESRRAVGQRRRLQERADDRRDVLRHDLMGGLRLEPDAEQHDLLLCEKAWLALLRLG